MPWDLVIGLYGLPAKNQAIPGDSQITPWLLGAAAADTAFGRFLLLTWCFSIYPLVMSK